MRTTRASSIGLLLFLAACGTNSRSGIVATPTEPVISIVVLDPAGRLLDQGERPELFRIDEGVATHVSAWYGEGPVPLDTPPSANTELLVVARGCKPRRVPLLLGRNFVRLEAGFRVRVSISGTAPALPDNATLGMVLERRVNALAEIELPRDLTLHALAADAFDADMPTHPQYMAIPKSQSFDILVPLPGPYKLSWDVRFGNGASSTQHRRAPYVLEPGMGALDVAWATPSIERMVKLMRKGR